MMVDGLNRFSALPAGVTERAAIAAWIASYTAAPWLSLRGMSTKLLPNGFKIGHFFLKERQLWAPSRHKPLVSIVRTEAVL